MATFKYHALKIIGNFGAGFLSPLVGSGFANMIFNDVITMEHALIIAIISSTIATSLSAFNELRIYGETSGISH